MTSRPKQDSEEMSWPVLESFSALGPQPTRVGAIQRASLRRALDGDEYQLVKDGASFTISDISMNGLALRLSDAAELLAFPVGSEVSGVLNLGGKPLAFRARVKHQRVGLVGCQFEEASQPLLNEITRLLDPSGIAGKVRKTKPFQGATHAFTGPAKTAVLIWEEAGEVSQLAIYLMGIFVLWDSAGLKTGIAQPQSATEWKVISEDEAPS
ncbi:MAG TPA: PilZ domain-containing protein, partial [Bdellovibrionota bacterium]|nr:PilZ domain-containing protein [Bdellovibrionota bacterium]